MAWQEEIVDLLAYGRRIGLTFEQAWREAVECVEVPGLARGRGGEQLELRSVPDETVLDFFRRACRKSWEGEEIAPAGWSDTATDAGGVFAHGASRGVGV